MAQQTWEGIQAKLAAVGYKETQGRNRSENWGRPRTRDEMIAHFETDWDKLKNFWAANPETAAGTNDAFNLQKFNNFEDWKNWFMQQHPTNEVVMSGWGNQAISTQSPTAPPVAPTGALWGNIGNAQPTIKQPTATPMTQPNPIAPSSQTGFDIGSSNYEMWKKYFGNVNLPSGIIGQNKFSGMTTGWENPYYKKLFNK